MNERIKQLAEQAGFVGLAIHNLHEELERFAELIRDDEREKTKKCNGNIAHSAAEAIIQQERK